MKRQVGLVMAAVVALTWPVCAMSGLQSRGENPPKACEGESKDEALKNTLKWTTASEVENFGFDIYRGDLEEGPFEKMTEDPLPGAGTTDEPQSYLWEDFEIERGKDYFYYIESISMSGVRERFSPIIKAPAK